MWKAITELAMEHIVIPLALLMVNIVGPFFADILQKIILFFMILPLWVIKLLEEAVDIFSGVKPLSSGTGQGQTLVEYFMGQSVVTTVFWGITLISAALCIGFSIVAVVRSMGDLDVKRPVGKILGSVGKAMLTFLIIPFMCIAAITLAGLVLRQVSLLIDTAGTGEDPVSVSGALFMIAPTPETVPKFEWGELAWDKENDEFYWIESEWRANWAKYPERRIARFEELRRWYMTNTGDPSRGEPVRGTGWSDIPQIQEDFAVFSLLYPGNAFIMIIVSWFYVIMMLMVMMIFLRRIYELLLLYMVSPFFVAPMPLDEGEKFKAWREQFISTVIAGFGSIFMMKIFIILLPLIWNDNFRMHDNSFTNVVLKALLTAGGIYATYKSHTMISTIVSEKGSASERDTAQMGRNLVSKAMSDSGKGKGGGGKGGKGSKGAKGKAGASGNKNPLMAGNKGGGLLVKAGDIDFSKPPSERGGGIGGLGGKDGKPGGMGTGLGGDKGDKKDTRPLYERDQNVSRAMAKDGKPISDGDDDKPSTIKDVNLDIQMDRDKEENKLREEATYNPFAQAILEEQEEARTNPFLADMLAEKEAEKNNPFSEHYTGGGIPSAPTQTDTNKSPDTTRTETPSAPTQTDTNKSPDTTRTETPVTTQTNTSHGTGRTETPQKHDKPLPTPTDKKDGNKE